MTTISWYRFRPALLASVVGVAPATHLVTTQAHLPRYGHAAVLIGLLVFLAVVILLVIAVLRSRRR